MLPWWGTLRARGLSIKKAFLGKVNLCYRDFSTFLCKLHNSLILWFKKKKKALRLCPFKGQISSRMFKLVYLQKREHLISRRGGILPVVTLLHMPEEAAWVVTQTGYFATATFCSEKVLGADSPCRSMPLNYSASFSIWGTHWLKRGCRRIQHIKYHFESISLGFEPTFCCCFLIHKI